MKKLIVALVIAVLVIIGIAILKPWFVLVEGDQAVVLKFGQVMRVVTDAGLKWKTPFVETVTRYPKKIMSWDGAAGDVPTAEKQFLWVDVTARWRIMDAKLFYASLGTIQQAHGRMDDIIDSEVRKIIARYPLRETVRDTNVISEIKRSNVLASFGGSVDTAEGLSNISTLVDIKYENIEKGRRELSLEMLAEAGVLFKSFGMEIIDVIIRQIKYSDALTPDVYNRMIKERNQIAQAFRSDGEGEKAKWLGQTQRELKLITSDAERKAKEIKAKADAEALAIRNRAYGRDPDFADYWMALEEYKALLPKFNKTLTTDAEFFKYLYSRRGR
jgi:membrane protease subunit HflC